MADEHLDIELKRQAIALLTSYSEAGIDAFLNDHPRDRFAETREEIERRSGSAKRKDDDARSQSKPAHASGMQASTATVEPTRDARLDEAKVSFPAPSLPVSGDAAVADARERARSAASLAELEAALLSFEGCALRVTAKSCVFGNGREDADLMLVGEAPGRDEDLAGQPFVGRSGQLLDRMLQAIGLAREDVRVTNTVPWRPPGNRQPTPVETAMCLPFLQRHIELVRPKILVSLGNPASIALLDAREGILRLRGKWKSYTMSLAEDGQIPAMAMLHPAYLLRNPAQKRLAWRDLLTLQAKLKELTIS
ncbi:uracil-DNA glycosylase [Fulvimarina sp. MAC8]|uniref:uracil-DNA glycosylase n=1 Tax=Fulvimarina sp. MAC8 TaxID=3162874 RepID=UPI0032ECE5AF